MLQQNYQPSDANDLVALCNGTLRTLHVDYVGFVKDLVWASPEEQENLILSDLEIDQAGWKDWLLSADAFVDPNGKILAVERIGERE